MLGAKRDKEYQPRHLIMLGAIRDKLYIKTLRVQTETSDYAWSYT